LVPRIYHENQRLSRWVQKQRRQRKRKDQGVHSTLSDERQELLTSVGFCWDSHEAIWNEQFQSLKVFHVDHGHCIVPTTHPDSSLYRWVRYQRKQFTLYHQAGSKSSMNEERVLYLRSIGFELQKANATITTSTTDDCISPSVRTNNSASNSSRSGSIITKRKRRRDYDTTTASDDNKKASNKTVYELY